MVAPQPFFRPRGTPFSVLHRIRGLISLGHTVDLVTYPIGQSPVLPGLTIHRSRLPAGVRDVRIGPSVPKLRLDLPLFLDALRLARLEAFDLVHTHEEAGAIGALIRKRCGIPHLYDMHSSLPQQFHNFGRYNWPPVVALFKALERFIFRHSDAVIAICPALEQRAREVGYAGRLSMIENCLDFEVGDPAPIEIQRLRARLGLLQGPVIGYTGTLESYQGIQILVEAASILAQERPDVRFLIVGGDDQEIRALRSRAERLGCHESIVAVSAVPPEQVRLYQQAADVLVTCRAKGTNTPLKLYQYLRSGKPIVATDIPSHSQVLDGRCALLVAPEPAAVAHALLSVLDQPDLARRLVRGAKEKAETKYSDDQYLDKLQRIMKQVDRQERLPQASFPVEDAA